MKQKIAEANTRPKPPERPKEEPITAAQPSQTAEVEQLKKRLKRESDTNQKQQKLVEDQEGVIKVLQENQKK